MALRVRSVAVAGLGVTLVAACHGHPTAKPAPASSGPAADTSQAAALSKPATFKAKGIQLTYPGDWQPKKNPDYELMLIARGSMGDEPRITLDVPDLPPHLPFMIQMSRIEHDYMDDLKKNHTDLKVDENTDASSRQAISKLIRSHWMQEKTQHDDVALLMIHASGVYILDLRTADPQLNTVRGTFDSIRQSIQWLK